MRVATKFDFSFLVMTRHRSEPLRVRDPCEVDFGRASVYSAFEALSASIIGCSADQHRSHALQTLLCIKSMVLPAKFETNLSSFSVS